MPRRLLLRLLELQGRSPKLAVAKMRLVAQWGQLQPQECAVSTHKALLRSSASIVTDGGNKGAPKVAPRGVPRRFLSRLLELQTPVHLFL